MEQEAQLLYSHQKIQTATQHVARLDKLIAGGPKTSSSNQTEENIRHRMTVQARSIRNASLPQLHAAERKHLSGLTALAHQVKDIEAALKYKANMSEAHSDQR